MTDFRKQEDIKRLLLSECHLGTANLNFHMKKYVDHRTNAGIHILNIE